jgi:presqualene diphosphate synthase
MTQVVLWCIHGVMNKKDLPFPDESAAAHAEAVTRRSGTSFYWAMRGLPKNKRDAMFAVYAFCREVDDIADDPGEQQAKRVGLAKWRDQISRLYDGGDLEFQTARALLGPVRAFGLDKGDFLALIEGMEMDAEKLVRIKDTEQLLYYCDRVACAVGRLSNKVFGIDQKSGDQIAKSLGLALQLTNILRDVEEDARDDRLYLPRDLLSANGVTETEPRAVLDHPGVGGVCAEISNMAEEKFAEAARLLEVSDKKQMRPAVMMMEVYRRVLEKMQKRGWEHLSDPVSLSRLEKLWVVLRYGVF